jgi:predicted esterase
VVPAEASKGLPPLRSNWLVEIAEAKQTTVVMPPIDAVAPSRLIVAAHGAGDRADWACGGWRLGAQVTAFVACPQGHPMGPMTFAWVSPQQLEERALVTLGTVKARYSDYLAQAPYIFAGFSQGATFAEPFLRKHAAEFPIAILAEGGYRTMSSPSFAAAYRAAGGRRVVLLCGNPTCFVTARSAKKVLERAGLEALVVGDEKAGHNLNGRMQKALQGAWPQIVAPLPS